MFFCFFLETTKRKMFLFQSLSSKVLDSVSAQFAASALVTSDQLMAQKSKEEGILGVGVNGVVSASGELLSGKGWNSGALT